MKPIMHDPSGEGNIEDKKLRTAIKKAVLAKSESSTMSNVLYYYCHYCGTPLKRKNVTFDHMIPKSKGGSFTVSNLLVSCSRCNKLKASKDYFDFVK